MEIREMRILTCGCTDRSQLWRGHDEDGEEIWVHGCSWHSCTTPMNPQPDLSERFAECSYCKNTKYSQADLPFFEYRPSFLYDKFYCGCRGWD